MFQCESKAKTKFFRVGTLLASLLSISSAQLATFAADSVELKSLSPQIDTAPVDLTPPPPTTDDTPASKIHKLEASKQALKEEASDDSAPALSVEEGQQPGGPRIHMNTFSFRTNITTSVNNITTSSSTSSGSGTFGSIDPLVMLKAMFGGGGKGIQKLYAERDTGYGVCGFLMNMPIGKRGYAEILKSFPSMPAAEAGLRPGDLITSVNGQSTLDIPPREIWDWFTGMPGTEVKLELLRGAQPFNVTLKRMDIGRIPDFGTRAEFLTIFEHNGMSKFVQK
jgi:hypothetical protein